MLVERVTIPGLDALVRLASQQLLWLVAVDLVPSRDQATRPTGDLPVLLIVDSVAARHLGQIDSEAILPSSIGFRSRRALLRHCPGRYGFREDDSTGSPAGGGDG